MGKSRYFLGLKGLNLMRVSESYLLIVCYKLFIETDDFNDEGMEIF